MYRDTARALNVALPLDYAASKPEISTGHSAASTLLL